MNNNEKLVARFNSIREDEIADPLLEQPHKVKTVSSLDP